MRSSSLILGTGLLALAGCRSGARPPERATQPLARQGYVTVDGARLYYEESGSGLAVVMLHGGRLDRREWDNEFPALAREFRVIRYDSRGYGLSQSDSVPFSDHDDLRVLLDSLGIARAALVGHSFGGRTSIDFALAWPDRVTALVLVAPGLSGSRFSSDVYRRFEADMMSAVRSEGRAVGLAWFMRGWCDGPYRSPEQMDSTVRAKVLEMASGTGARRARREITSLGRGPEAPAAGRLGELRMPTLAVVGSLDMPDIIHIVDSVATRVRGARRVDISGVAHNVNMERPAEFLAAILPFLREHAR